MARRTTNRRPGGYPGPEVAAQLEDPRIMNRRLQLGLSPEAPRGALAFSGGGIRSATFSLGVLQALASKPLHNPIQQPRPFLPEPRRSLLWTFDYLSTVSGGGYIGSFFCSLFVPGRLRDSAEGVETARLAYDVVAQEPPGRIRSREDYSRLAPGAGPMAWLRENGRYLAPTGTGDFLYDTVLAIRNWLAVHYVIGTMMLFVLSALALVRCALAFVERARMVEAWLLPPGRDWFWLSPLGYLPLLVLVAWALPVGVAYWLTHPNAGGSVGDRPRAWTMASGATAVLGILLATAAFLARRASADASASPAAAAAGIAALTTVAGVIVYTVSARFAKTITEHRVVLTRWLASSVQCLLVLAFIALVDTLAQCAYLGVEHGIKTLTPASLVVALTWLVRRVALALDDRNRPRWLAKVPVDAAAAVVGGVLLLLLAISWDLVVQWLEWQGEWPQAGDLNSLVRLYLLSGVTVTAFILSFTAGRFPGFVNTSTLQWLYGMRLTRAYLGASNGRRFRNNADRALLSAAQPDERDQLTHEKYYGQDVLAPLHIINVTVNQTSDPAEQLTQRDRKGRPMAILPTGFTIDGRFARFSAGHRRYELDAALTIGDWIGTSGAAFTTGLGRETSLGKSLVFGLANVRLGTWWRSGCGDDESAGVQKLFEKFFLCQSFLWQELTATFYGLHRSYQYLSDGGHFENTAIYELLRPERNIRLIVACDAGADRAFHFDDLANLVRLARIDFGIEIQPNPLAPNDPHLRTVFGTMEQLAKPAVDGDGKCALLLDVFDTQPERNIEPRCQIVLIKPRCCGMLPMDVRNYALTHEAFPHEPTSDQFFDEAQWEAYRKLGLELGKRVIEACAAAKLQNFRDEVVVA